MANSGKPWSDNSRVPTSQRRIWSAISVAVASGSFADCLPFLHTQKRWLNGLRTSSMGFASSAFQADAEICWQSWHGIPPLMMKGRDANLALRLPQVLTQEYTTARRSDGFCRLGVSN